MSFFTMSTEWQADLAGYPKRPWLKEQSIWAIAVHRFGHYVDRMPDNVYRKVADRCYWLAFRFVETLTGISLPKEAEIGPGLEFTILEIFLFTRMQKLAHVASCAKG